MVATFVAVYETLREAGVIIPHDFPGLTVEAGQAFNLTSFALSLLLVFRTNESYSRWLEARKAWSAILLRSRDLVRQGFSWFSEDQQRQDMLLRWTIAFVRCSMSHVREECNLEAQLRDTLEPHELEQLMAAQHRPGFVLRILSELIWGADLLEGQAMRMDEALTYFGEQIGTCERHTSRFLVMWLAFLPFSLWDACHWVTIPASGIIAFLLLGIEEIGVQIEEPFGILPLEQICDLAEDEIRHQRTDTTVQNIVTIGLKRTGAASNGAGPSKMPANVLRRTKS
ncbi:g4072 [Coccomyxa elongata]